jgi:hypothetical protein
MDVKETSLKKKPAWWYSIGTGILVLVLVLLVDEFGFLLEDGPTKMDLDR